MGGGGGPNSDRNDPYGRNGGEVNGGGFGNRPFSGGDSVPNSLRESFGEVAAYGQEQWEEDELRKREIAEVWRQREAEEELARLQQDIDAKRREIEKLASENQGVGSSLRMAGEDIRSTQQARSEEARRWAADEASRKTGNDYSNDYHYQDSGQRGYDARSESDRIQEIYLRWCKYYGKEANESRFAIFADNLYEAEKYAASRDGQVQLSAFADLTSAEYRRREEEAGRRNRNDSTPTRKYARRQEDWVQWDSEFPPGSR